jgi:hypothetical protein
VLRNFGITSREHTFTTGTWFSSDMPVSVHSVAHTINVVHTNLVLINRQLQYFLWLIFQFFFNIVHSVHCNNRNFMCLKD